MTTKSKTAKPNAVTAKTRTAKKSKARQRGTTRKTAPKNIAPKKQTKAKAPRRDNSKLATVIAMLRRKEGATIAQLVAATGWQAHSVRGAMSGTLRKKHNLTISSTKTDGVRTYRVTA